MPTMQAMALRRPRRALVMSERPIPTPAPGEIMVMVTACGVCRTDLHVVDGELSNPVLPIVPGHEIVGHVRALGPGVGGFAIGDRVGVPWLGATCGICPYCRGNRENLCDNPAFTGYTRDGGFATHVIADARFCFRLGEAGEDAEIAPWLCAGLIGWRSYRRAGEGTTVGLYGFGAAAHILAQIANGKADACLLSPVRAIKPRRTLRAPSVPNGRAHPKTLRPNHSMPRSYSHPSAHCCRLLSRR
jgi:alcohol dehydrogenase, propanol-preferring